MAELKRLVPSAFEKQGSAKLEKAEILQLTTEHLKALQARGLNNPVSMEVDYRSMGFRECIAEVSRYLSSVEGLDSQNPLRMRLVSHLEAFGAQREVTLKHELASYNSWSRFNYSTHGLHYSSSSASPDPILVPKLKDPSYAACAPANAYFAQTSGAHTSPNAAYATAHSNYGVDAYRFRPW